MSHTLRLPQIDLGALLAQQHPTIDLRVHNYDNSTRNFLKALTSYKNRALTTISDRRKHQAAEKKKTLERTHAVETETKQCKLKEIDLVARVFFGTFTEPYLSNPCQSLSAKRRNVKTQNYPLRD